MRGLIFLLGLAVTAPLFAQGMSGDAMSAAAQINWAEDEKVPATSEVASTGQWIDNLSDEFWALRDRGILQGDDGDIEYQDHCNDFLDQHNTAWRQNQQADYHIRMGNAHLSLAYVVFGRGNYSSATNEATSAIGQYWLGTAEAVGAHVPATAAQTDLAEATARLDELE